MQSHLTTYLCASNNFIMRITLFLITLFVGSHAFSQYKPIDMINGNWMGIDMYQDEGSYDGKNFFLPNEEFIIIEKEKIRIYFYPYSKSDEYTVTIDEKQISYEIGRKRIETNYHFTNPNCDTLVFTMHFINKSFVKLYSRVTSMNERMEVDFATIKELDQYGFNPSSIHHLFEIDTFHHDLYHGFSHIDSLEFKPFQFIQFLNDKEISINREASVPIERGYKTIRFKINGLAEKFEIVHSEGTQSFSIIPVSHCFCDDINIPYITVDWADRIRADMKENAHKYRN